MSTALEQTAPSRALVTKLELPTLPDDLLCEYRGAVAEQREDLKSIEHAIDLEIERRLRERNARELPHPKFTKIAMEDQWSAYVADYEALLEAANILRALGHDEDAVKVIKHVPEQVTVIQEHYEYGNPVSIAALIRKFGAKSQIGELLTRGLTRAHLGTRLSVKVKPVVATHTCVVCKKTYPEDTGGFTADRKFICNPCDDLRDEMLRDADDAVRA